MQEFDFDTELRLFIRSKAMARSQVGKEVNWEDLRKLLHRWYLRIRGRTEKDFCDFFTQTLLSSTNFINPKTKKSYGISPQLMNAIRTDLFGTKEQQRHLMLRTIMAIVDLRDVYRGKKKDAPEATSDTSVDVTTIDEDEDDDSDDSEEE